MKEFKNIASLKFKLDITEYEEIIKRSMLQSIAENPVLLMKDEREFKNIIASLKFKLDITE